MGWVGEKREELQKVQEQELRKEIELGVQDIVKNQPAATPQEADNQVRALSEKLSDHIERVMAETEKGIREITGSFVTGNIELNNQNHKLRLIEFLILLQEVKAPPELMKAEQVFKKFSDADIAAILHLHFEAFKEDKFNTVYRKVGHQKEVVKGAKNRVKKLEEALQEFFYR